ncbi:hypothetical protein [Actinoplanes couchii]|uniref:hypothetical protein n=1 Tax=Actinoplanes couchii TaxID=403638 RepID=UPI0019434297|nr:hypothetical protein [Actinoplanes couchii]MDR6324050.1 hypothetical protein [Actinoplanes couchii]
MTVGLLLFAVPAQAAPESEAAGEVTEAAVSAAEIAANNAAVWESLPPNVTMTVLGEMPELVGPIDHYTQDGPTTTTGVTALAAATVPYNFTFDGVHDWPGRDFKSTKTKICKDIEVTWDSPEASWHKFQVKLSKGGTVTVPTDGVARSYCWSGVPTNTIMFFNYKSTNNEDGDIAFASGSGRVRYA